MLSKPFPVYETPQLLLSFIYLHFLSTEKMSLSAADETNIILLVLISVLVWSGTAFLIVKRNHVAIRARALPLLLLSIILGYLCVLIVGAFSAVASHSPVPCTAIIYPTELAIPAFAFVSSLFSTDNIFFFFLFFFFFFLGPSNNPNALLFG